MSMSMTKNLYKWVIDLYAISIYITSDFEQLSYGTVKEDYRFSIYLWG